MNVKEKIEKKLKDLKEKRLYLIHEDVLLVINNISSKLERPPFVNPLIERGVERGVILEYYWNYDYIEFHIYNTEKGVLIDMEEVVDYVLIKEKKVDYNNINQLVKDFYKKIDKASVKEKIEKRLKDLKEKYSYLIHKDVLLIINKIANQLEHFPFISPLYENDLVLEYDNGDNFIDFDIYNTKEGVLIDMEEVIDNILVTKKNIDYNNISQLVNIFFKKEGK